MSGTDKETKPPENKTIVCLLGELNIDQEKVSVGAVCGEETLVQLDKPAPLGNALTVGTWLNNSWGTKVDALVVKTPDATTNKVGSQSDVKAPDVEKNLKTLGFPEQIVTPLAQLILAKIVITDLYVRLWKEKVDNKPVDRKAFKFGIAVDFANDQNAKGLNCSRRSICRTSNSGSSMLRRILISPRTNSSCLPCACSVTRRHRKRSRKGKKKKRKPTAPPLSKGEKLSRSEKRLLRRRGHAPLRDAGEVPSPGKGQPWPPTFAAPLRPRKTSSRPG